MKTIATALFLGVGLQAVASGVFVGNGKEAIVDIESDSVQSDTVVVSSPGKLVKKGAGKLTLKTGALAQDWNADVEVREGTLKIESSDTQERTFTGVEAILAKAALHLDASDEDSLVGDDDKVAEWLDTRETGSAAAGYKYSRAVANTMAADIPELGLSAANLQPVKSSTGGKAGVYFNGYSSGTWMNLVKPDGKQESLKLFNVFVVQAVVSANGLGTILGVNIGNAASANLGFVPRNATGNPVPMWQNPTAASAGALTSSRTSVNGLQIDGYNAGLPVGEIALFDVEMLGAGALWENIFNDRGYTGLNSATIPDVAKNFFRTGAGELRSGGEYIFEIVAFTSALSAAERTELAAYLRQKWLGAPTVSKIAVDSSSAALVELSNADASVLSLAGDGDFKVVAGTSGLRRALAYRLSDKERLIADGTEKTSAIGTPEYSSFLTEEAGSAAIAGGAQVRINKIDNEIKKLSVESGELILESPRIGKGTVEAVVAGGNGSFEFGKESYDQTKDFSNNGGFQGWNHFTESGRGGAVFVYNQSKSGGKNTATWAIPNSSPAGDVALGIKQDASAWTEVVVTQKGRYKLSFVASCRQAASGVGYSCDIAIGKDSGSLATAGVFTVPFHDGMYHPYEYMVPELEAGTYQLWFKSRNTGRDLCAVIDDVKLVKATDDDFIKVPNGDFEKCNYDKLPSLSNGIYWFYYASTKLHYGREALQDWVLTQDDGNAAVPVAYRGAAPVSARTTTEWGGIDEIGRFAELDGAGDSLVQLFMSSGCRASVSFTPPAGSYRVCASAAVRLADSKAAVDMSLVAGVTPEGSEKVELGEANLKNVFRMKQVLLPNVFTVDGNTEITLELAPKNNAGDHGYLVVDNVKLMRLEKFNQLANGDFEAKSANWTGTIYTYGSNPGAWGSDRASGSYCGQLQKTAVLSQDLTVPAAGLYRLRLMARTRQTTANSNIDRYGRNPVAVDLIDLEDGSSPARRIALFTPVYTNFTEFSWCVKVPKSGRYRLNLAGQSADSDRTSFIDDVSLVLENAAEVPEIPDDLALVVESGAKLRLDFAGTKKVGKVKLDGKVFKGTINAEKYPQYVSGDGTLCVEPKNPGAIFIR